MKYKTDSITLKKHKAHRLYVANLMSAKEVSAKVGVSENTMVKWVRNNKWKTLRDERINEIITNNGIQLTNATLIISDFKEFLRLREPDFYKKIEPIASDYLDQI